MSDEGARQTVCVDFDGVLHSYTSGWTGLEPTDPPVPGAQDFCRRLQREFEVVILTTRAREEGGAKAVAQWLFDNGFPDRLRVTCEKVPAIAYVDDRAVPFNTQYALDYAAASPNTRTNVTPWDMTLASVFNLRKRGHGAKTQQPSA